MVTIVYGHDNSNNMCKFSIFISFLQPMNCKSQGRTIYSTLTHENTKMVQQRERKGNRKIE